MQELSQHTIDDGAVSLFNKVTNFNFAPSNIVRLLDKPSFETEDSVNYREHAWMMNVSDEIVKAWENLSWETRVAVYLVAEDAARERENYGPLEDLAYRKPDYRVELVYLGSNWAVRDNIDSPVAMEEQLTMPSQY